MTVATDEERAALLDEFLRELHDQPVVWGETDCTAAPAKWVRRAAGIAVPMARYSSEEDAARHIERAGGLVPLWVGALANVGIYERYGEPQLGDVAVVRLRGVDRGCIIANGGIAAIRTTTRSWFLMVPRRFEKVWALPA